MGILREEDGAIINLTLAELEEMITAAALPIGQKYYVTDKDWLLYANTPSTMKPVSGSLHIFNGQTLPTGVEPDVLLIDTGIIDWDISALGTPLVVDVPLNYSAIMAHIDVIYNSDVVTFTYNTAPIGFEDVSTSSIFSVTLEKYLNVLGCSFGSSVFVVGDKVRFLIEFQRSELSVPIPVPQIVSAEVDEMGQIIVTMDSDFNTYTQDITVISSIQGSCFDSIGDMPDERTIYIYASSPVVYGETILLSMASGAIKNTWGGLLAEVVDYPVVNNVPEPEYLHFVSAEAVSDSDIIIVCDKEPLEISGDLFIYVNSSEVSVSDIEFTGNEIRIHGINPIINPNDVVTLSSARNQIVAVGGIIKNDHIVNFPVVNNSIPTFELQTTTENYSFLDGGDYTVIRGILNTVVDFSGWVLDMSKIHIVYTGAGTLNASVNNILDSSTGKLRINLNGLHNNAVVGGLVYVRLDLGAITKPNGDISRALVTTEQPFDVL